ncbi:hypothetical protein MKC73_08870 [[Clostridium] innocuum]|nr:hypothetical protein [[Clostridium] innocuum]
MKKSTLLSLLTAGAVIATSAGTFAAWDQTSISTNEAEVTIGNKVTMEVGTMSFNGANSRTELSTTDNDFSQLSQTGNVKFTVKDIPDGAKDNYTVTYKSAVKDNSGTVVTDKVEVNVADDKNGVLSGGAIDEHEATVTVTPKDASAAGETYKVTVTAELTPVNTAS